MKTIREAATDLCDRWETKLWKDAEHTAVFIHELRMALTQPEQEPVACEWRHHGVVVNAFPHSPGDPSKWDRDGYFAKKSYTRTPLYRSPPKRQPLTFVDIMLIAEKFPRIHAWIPADELSSFVAAVEAKLKELNHE